jgi:alkylhydroperoxidase family enzyme
MNFEDSPTFTDRQKAALAYAEAIAWHLDAGDEFWSRMHHHFSEPELVETADALTESKASEDCWARRTHA